MVEFDRWLVPREVTVHVDAAPDVVYALVSDPERIGEWSPECRSAHWLGDGRGVGARFRGDNRSGIAFWSRTCEVVTAEPDVAFEWRTVPGTLWTDDSTLWGFRLEAADGGTLLTQHMRMLQRPQAWFRPIVRVLFPQHLDMRDQMRTTLDGIRRAAERAARSSG